MCSYQVVGGCGTLALRYGRNLSLSDPGLNPQAFPPASEPKHLKAKRCSQCQGLQVGSIRGLVPGRSICSMEKCGRRSNQGGGHFYPKIVPVPEHEGRVERDVYLARSPIQVRNMTPELNHTESQLDPPHVTQTSMNLSSLVSRCALHVPLETNMLPIRRDLLKRRERDL
ncbi:unnamed protein product [Pleuronectes platessa]|uniref:Uncharacterized protein n=1 Tax=Pleuronectes platessa TaxID=8262 RepID=A0A9N7UKL5_PLEPL|nr:unnamed protein product [Pleuronectes platessa]